MSSSGNAMAMAMGGMDMTTFSFTTDVTLFFAGWRTDTPAKYFGTLIFTFLLTLINRFLGAWRSQLGHKWANQAAEARIKQLKQRKQRRKGRHEQLRKESLSDELKADLEPLTHVLGDQDDNGKGISLADDAITSKEEQIRASFGPKWTRFLGNRWRAGNPWTFSLDAPRALLEGLRALIGYLMMLAVMTFNVGFFIAIISGVIVGEFILGRFISGTAWEEDACHDG